MPGHDTTSHLLLFLISNSYENCIRTTISIGGDYDTTSAISGAIVEAYYKVILNELIEFVKTKLPQPKNGCDRLKVVNMYLKPRNKILKP